MELETLDESSDTTELVRKTKRSCYTTRKNLTLLDSYLHRGAFFFLERTVSLQKEQLRARTRTIVHTIGWAPVVAYFLQRVLP